MQPRPIICGSRRATRGGPRLRLVGLLLMVICWCAAARGAGAQVLLQTVYTSAAAQGVVPFSGLVEAPDGYFYGTTPANNIGNYGSLFRLSRAGVVTVLVHFTGPNGKDPEGGLVLANDGNLYGTTFSGGANGLGILFKFSQPAGVFQLLHSFTTAEGPGPSYTLIQASDGFLYGVTAGMSTNPAIIFRATTAGAVTVLTNFPSGLTPTSPSDGLVEGPDGWLYGTATIHSFSTPGPIGSIYKVATSGAYQTLATFSDALSQPLHGDGLRPIGGLAVGPDGLLYGTIGHNVSPLVSGDGSIFKMTTNGVRTTIASFNGTNGSNPMTRLTLGNDGAFYGFAGSLFRVTTNGTLTAIVTNGFGAYGIESGPPPLLLAQDGNLYGTGMTVVAGNPAATAFRLVAPTLVTWNLPPSGGVTLTWNSFNQGTYQVAFKSSLGDTNWTTVGLPITAGGDTTSFSDSPAPGPQRYYRVVLLP